MRPAVLFSLLAVLLMLGVSDAHARGRANRFAITPPDVESLPAYRYASYDSAACVAELTRRKVPFERVAEAANVDTPVRFTGPVRGVAFRTTYRERESPEAPATIADCRLALAIDDLAEILAARGVVEAEYLSMYRPRRGAVAGRRHPAGLAIDLATIRLRDGRRFSVYGDFHGRVGAQTCGDGAAPPRKDTEGARLWRDIACALAARGSYNLILTPNYNWGHRDHFHLEVRTKIRWFLVQ